MFHNEQLEKVHSHNVTLIPCSICSTLFDPATLPSHVYDPYRTFFSSPGHSTLCSSCFAEELARRTRPPSSNPSPVPPTQAGVETDVYNTQYEGDFGRSNSNKGIIDARQQGLKSLDLVRPSTSFGEKRTGLSATPPMSEHQERSDSAFAATSSLTRRSSSRSVQRQKHQHHRKASSVTTISRNPSVSMSSPSDTATMTAGSRSVSGSTFASIKGQIYSKHKKAESLASFKSLNFQNGTGSLERAREFKSQEVLSSSNQSSEVCVKRTASIGRDGAKTPFGNAFALSLPQTSGSGQTQKLADTSDGTTSSKSSGEAVSGVKRQVSFRQGAPASKSFNPQSPPSKDVGTASPLVEGFESGSGSSGYGSVLNIPGLMNMSTGAGGVRTQTDIGTAAAADGDALGDVAEIPEEDVAEPERGGFWFQWLERRKRERKQREVRREIRRERQFQRNQREDEEKGIGLELFCSHCRVVVRTVPRWREGSCCFLSAGCLLLCTGPLSLCLLFPCAAHQVMDVDGQCPNCDSILSHWNRRKNMLTVHTWAGIAGETAPPLTGEGITPTVIVPSSGMGGSTGIGIPLVPLAAIQGQLASSPLSPNTPGALSRPNSRPETGSSSIQTRQQRPGPSSGGVLGGVLVLAQDIHSSTPRSSSTGSGPRYSFDPPPLPSLPPGLRLGAVAPTRHLRTPSNASASLTYIGGNTTSSDPTTSSPSTSRSFASHHHRRQPSLTYSASVSGNAASSSSGQSHLPASSSTLSAPGSMHATPRSVVTTRTGGSSIRAGPSHARNVSMSTSYTGRGARNSAEDSNSGSLSGRASVGSYAGGSARERDSGGSGSLPPVGETEGAEERAVELQGGGVII